MSARPPHAKPGSSPAAEHGAHSFEDLARLIRDDLDCDAVVLQVDNRAAAGIKRPAGVGRTTMTITACRDGVADDLPLDLLTLLHPRSALDAGMRFYAGLPLRDRSGRMVGRLAAMDAVEREMTADDLLRLRQLAALAAEICAVRRIGLAA